MHTGVAHSRTASDVKSLSIGSFFIGVHGPESMLGLCGTRTQTDGTGAMDWCWFDDVLLLFAVVTTAQVHMFLVMFNCNWRGRCVYMCVCVRGGGCEIRVNARARPFSCSLRVYFVCVWNGFLFVGNDDGVFICFWSFFFLKMHLHFRIRRMHLCVKCNV